MPLFDPSINGIPVCPLCHRVFRTTQGANAHITTNKKCSARMAQSFESTPEAFNMTPPSPFAGNPEPIEDPQSIEQPSSPDWDSALLLEEFDDVNFDLPLHLDPWVLAPKPAEAPGPSSRLPRTFDASSRISPSLLQPEDNRFVEPHPPQSKSGWVFAIRSPGQDDHDMDEDGDTAMGSDSDDQRFRPFNSELDWKIAQWAVKDSASHAAFDRFLEIPGVRCQHWALILNTHASSQGQGTVGSFISQCSGSPSESGRPSRSQRSMGDPAS